MKWCMWSAGVNLLTLDPYSIMTKENYQLNKIIMCSILLDLMNLPSVIIMIVYFVVVQMCIRRGNQNINLFQFRQWISRKKILQACNEFPEEWANTIRSRLLFAQDLPATDTVYRKLVISTSELTNICQTFFRETCIRGLQRVRN